MTRAGEWLRRPVVLGILCFATGAAVAVLVLGVPVLWTSTAAGWAAAVGTVAAAAVALYLGRVAIASELRSESTQTVALSVMLGPFLNTYAERTETVKRKIAFDGHKAEQLLYAGLLVAAKRDRQELFKQGELYSHPGVGPLLSNWSGAHPSLVRRVAELAAQIQSVSAAMRLPYQVAPEDEQFNDAYAHLDLLRALLRGVSERIEDLQRHCAVIARDV